MCFVLFVGTSSPIPLKEWVEEPRGLAVQVLAEDERPVAAHFSKPNVQYVGSTSGCGCDFPFSEYESGESAWFEDLEGEALENETFNRRALVELIRECREAEVELYGMWNGDYTIPPASRSIIQLEEILDQKFHFMERAFYVVKF